MPDPDQLRRELERDLDQASRDADRIGRELGFADLCAPLHELPATLEELAAELARLRARGYRWRGDLETTLTDARGRHAAIRADVTALVDRYAAELGPRAGEVEREARRLAHGDPTRHRAAVQHVLRERDALQGQVQAAEQAIRAALSPLTGPVDAARAKIADLHWTLDRFEGATFRLDPAESVVAAARATWDDSPAGKVEGHLLFTDHRVRFEQDEEVVTKRTFLVFAAEKERRHRLLLDEPIGALARSDDSTRGLLFKSQHLTFAWAPADGKARTTTFTLESGSARDWDGVVELLRSGDLSRFEANGTATASSAPLLRFPAACATCGAPLPPPVKGERALVCPYCGRSHPGE